MLPSAAFIFSLVLLCTSAINNPSPPPSESTILLNCGTALPSSKSSDGRTWNGDSNSKFRSSNTENSSETSATEQHTTLNAAVPYMTARISLSNLTYNFPLLPGSKFIRLYFYPATYSSSALNSSKINTSDSFFTVSANNFTLLKNFSASLHLLDSIPRVAYLIKEFIVTVPQNQILQLTFSPSPSSLVFINGIEIVPIPDNLYIKAMDYSYTLVNDRTLFYFYNPTAFETIHRLNVGGGFTTDTEMFRRWEDDYDYIYSEPGYVNNLSTAIHYTQTTPSYTAPPIVYKTARYMGPDPPHNLKYNLTWLFSVDSGFDYLVRLHFCEIEKAIFATNQRVFFIYINNMTVNEDGFDVFNSAGGRDIPVYQDYIVKVPEGSERKQDFWLALHPRSDVNFADAILNGLEIFKLSKSNGDLFGLNPVPPTSPEQPSTSRDKRNSKSGILPIIGSAAGGIFVLCLVIFFVRRRKGKEDTGTVNHKSSWLPLSYISSSTATFSPLLPTDLCRQFTVAEIRAATRNFHDENVVGSGGFGTVYKGFIETGSVSVPGAIKRLDSSSKQGVREFHTEIEMLSKLRHAHLVSLIGYCADEDEMILVYEFMDQGNLQDHIWKAKKIHLPWKKRLQICIGAAKGLHYLHTGAEHTIIHRDVKSSNILLDSNWIAKVSDFGLSKTGPASVSQTHVSTFVRGSFGYIDPEYYRRQQLTEKSDVYSFGVVLLEVVYARPPIVSTLTKAQVNLVEWARTCYKKGTIDENIEPQLKGDIATVSLNKFMEIAESCVREKGTERPTMGEVVWGLEFALQLQETTEKDVDANGDDEQKSLFIAHRKVVHTDDDNVFTSSSGATVSSMAALSISESSFSNNDYEGARPENVFSEMMNHEGR